MGVRLFLVCVVLYEITFASSPGAVTLPFKDLVATVTPRKPKPLSPETASQVPIVLPSSDAILAYYKSEFPDKDLSSLVCKFSSPLVLTSTSKTLLPKIDTFKNDLSNRYTSPQYSPLLPMSYSSKCDSMKLPYTSNLPVPYVSPVIAKSIQPTYLNDIPLINTPFISDYTPISTLIPTTDISLSSISSLPIVSLDSLRLSPSSFSPDLSPYSQYPSLNKFSFSTPVNPSYSLPYPLRYNQLSLPNVVTPVEQFNSNFGPISFTESKYSNQLNPSLVACQSAFNSLSFEYPYSSKKYSNSLIESPNLFNKELLNRLPLSSFSEYPQIRSSRTIFNPVNTLPKASVKSVAAFNETLPNFRPHQEIIPEYVLPGFYITEENNPSPVSFVNSPEVYEVFASPTTDMLPSSSISTKYTTVSPSLLKATSINNFVSEITQNIISSLNTRIALLKRPGGKKRAYLHRQSKYLPKLKSRKLLNTKATLPVLSQLITPSSVPLINSPPISAESISLTPSYPSDFLSTSVSAPIMDITPSLDYSSLAPVKVALLPPTSFADYAPPLCPSYLPSPILPTYLDYSSPVLLEPQVIKTKKINKNAKIIEKLLQLVFLAELLNGDGYVDWDALDVLLAILCID